MTESSAPTPRHRRDGHHQAPPTEFLHVVRLAARLTRAPIALIDADGARLAWSDPALRLDAKQLERLYEIGRHLDSTPAAATNAPAVVPDATHDPRLWHNPSVIGAPGLRFIAGIPLIGTNGGSLGLLCVMDNKPRPCLTDDHADALADLATLAARMTERENGALARRRTEAARERVEQIEAAVIRAQTCELALAGMLVALCKHHGASSGVVGKLPNAATVLQEVCYYNDDPGSGLGFEPAEPMMPVIDPPLLDPALATLAIQAGTPRVHRFPANEAAVIGLQAEVIQPIHLIDERFGLILRFARGPADLNAIAEDIAAMVRLVRPALYRKAAERRMRLLGTALDRANDAILITEAGPLGASGPRIVYANASFCRESGYAMDEVLGEPHAMLHGPGTDQTALAQLRQEMRQWKPVRAELLNMRKDGTEFWAELDLTPITDESGLPTHWISIQRDVTQRRNADAAQRRYEASFRMLFQDNPLPMVVMHRNGLRFIEVNDAAVAQYGWSRTEFLSRTLNDLGRGEPLVSGAASSTHIVADGRAIEVRAFVNDILYGGDEATLAVLWEVTDLEAARRDMHQANAMLRERTLQLRARTEELAEAQRLARLGTWRMGGDDRMTWSREMFDLMDTPRDMAPVTLDVLLQKVHAEDREAVGKALATARRHGTSQHFEYRVALPDDQVRHLRAEVRPVPVPQDGAGELFGYSQDISDNKRAEQALLRNEALRALGQLTGGVAHDFNNLLTVVILNLEEAQEILPSSHELQEILVPALHAAVRGAELTSQLLSYARRATLRPERVRPDEFFGALRPLLNRVLGERFELQVLLRHNGGSAMVDPAQLDSAVMNLVINARDAMAQGGTIVLETRSVTLQADSPGFQDDVVPGRYVVISVGDRGSGIPAHVLPRVFEPFFTTKAAGKGSGMGLSMVYGFARQSGGHVTIDSKPDRGTTVRLFLPVAAGVSEQDEQQIAGPAEWTANGLRVLVVEDQENVLATVSRMLRALGFSVTPAMTADAAIAHIDTGAPYDLLFTDVVLPGEMDGVGLAEEVALRSPSTRILLTSGFTEHSLAAQDVTGPGVDFLMKPYKRQDLQAKFTAMFPRTSVSAF